MSGKSTLGADERVVRAPDTHSAETSLIVWHLEQWIRDSVRLQADSPNTFSFATGGGGPGKAFDIVQVLTNIRKLHDLLEVGNPKERLRASTLQGDKQDISACLDHMRHFINRAKHVRFDGFVYATDLSSIFETTALIRSMLFLAHGGRKLYTRSVDNTIPRLPKSERYYISRLFYAAKNSASALSDQDQILVKVRETLKLKYPTNFDWRRRIPAAALTLEVLPKARWIYCKTLVHDELENVTNSFRDWIQYHKHERHFGGVAALERNKRISTDDVIDAARQDLFPTNDPRREPEILVSWNTKVKWTNRVVFSISFGTQGTLGSAEPV